MQLPKVLQENCTKLTIPATSDAHLLIRSVIFLQWAFRLAAISGTGFAPGLGWKFSRVGGLFSELSGQEEKGEVDAGLSARPRGFMPKGQCIDHQSFTVTRGPGRAPDLLARRRKSNFVSAPCAKLLMKGHLTAALWLAGQRMHPRVPPGSPAHSPFSRNALLYLWGQYEK